MKIVVDSGVDLCLSQDQQAEFGIHQVPLSVTFQGKTYREGIDITRDDFYSLLSKSNDFPITSQPSPGLIAETYAKIVETDADILSVHMSSGLSNTINAAKLAANLVPQAQITHYDTKTLSVTSGWQVIAAAQAIKLGWQKEKIIELMQRISNAANSIFTLNELRYLRHGGRISHMKGLLASLLNIKPLIGVEKVNGTYTQLGQSRSFGSAIEKISSLITRHIPAGATIRAQIVHGQNHDGAEMLKKSIEQKYKCKWLPTCAISLVLGSHTGPSVVGIAFAPEAAIADAL